MKVVHCKVVRSVVPNYRRNAYPAGMEITSMASQRLGDAIKSAWSSRNNYLTYTRTANTTVFSSDAGLSGKLLDIYV